MLGPLAITNGTVYLRSQQFIDHAGRTHTLTPLECRLLDYLVQASDRPISRSELLVMVWGYAPTVNSRAADRAIARLRLKVEVSAGQPDHLVSVHGVGYRWIPLSPFQHHEDQRFLHHLRAQVASAPLSAVVVHRAGSERWRQITTDFDATQDVTLHAGNEQDVLDALGGPPARTLVVVRVESLPTLLLPRLLACLASLPDRHVLFICTHPIAEHAIHCPWLDEETTQASVHDPEAVLRFARCFPQGAPVAVVEDHARAFVDDPPTGELVLRHSSQGARLVAPASTVPDDVALDAYIDWAVGQSTQGDTRLSPSLARATEIARERGRIDEAVALFTTHVDLVGRFREVDETALLESVQPGSPAWTQLIVRQPPERLTDLPEIHRRLGEIAERHAHSDPAVSCCAHQRLAGLLNAQGDPSGTEWHLLAALEIAEASGVLQLELDVRVRLSALLLYDDLPRARRLILDALDKATQHARWRSVAQLLALRANVESSTGRVAQAIEIYRGLLPVLRNTGGRRAYYAMTSEYALLLTLHQGPEAAMRTLDGALLEARTAVSTYGVAYLQACRGAVFAHDGALEMASWAWREARAAANPLIDEFIDFEVCFFERVAGQPSPVPTARTRLGAQKVAFLLRHTEEEGTPAPQSAHLHRWASVSEQRSVGHD
jgi:DNA-binding winged helix-turn-helix (wHTH) protein